MNRLYISFILLFFACFAWSGEDLTFPEAVEKVLKLSPKLKISESEIEEKVGNSIQAGLYPNPVASYSIENVRSNSATSYYELAQLIELGNKRNFRISTAHYQYYAAASGFEVSQLELLNRLMKLFVQAVAAQEYLQVAQEQKKIAEEVFNSVAAKVEVGKVSSIQQHKAEMALSDLDLILAKAQLDFDSAKTKLSLLWGKACPDFNRLLFPFYAIEEPKTLDACLEDLRNNPELLKSEYEHLASHQLLKLEKSNAFPDLILTIGYKSVEHKGDKGMIVGASIPLPVFNRNQGNIYRAQTQISKTEEQMHELLLKLENKLALSHQELMRGYLEVLLYQTTILNCANKTFNLAKEGYLEGKFEYSEMLDSQRTLFEVKEKYIQSLSKYFQSRADVEYLTSRSD